jgi:S-formylglutathione hydrolase FrmB
MSEPTAPTSAPSPTEPPIPPTNTPNPTATPVPPTDTSSPTETTAPAKPINRVVIPAPALANNLLGDPVEREIGIYLPPSYFIAPDKRYPVVYFLAGHDEGLDAIYTLGSLMKNMLEAGTAKEMIIVVVSGQNALGGSFYVNSPVSGNWEDFIVSDVVGYVDKNYRTLTTNVARGMAGFSMGGFGALNLAMRHPDVFGAVYALSPGLFAADGLSKSQMFSNQAMIEAFLALEKELTALSPAEAKAQFVKLASQNYDLRFTVGYGVAFAPNPGKNSYVDYPYNGTNDQPDREAWQKWESGYGGIAEEVQQYKANLLKLKGILVDCGTRDQYRWIPEGCQFFSQQLEAEKIPHQLVSYEGGHGPVSDRAEAVMLPFFSEVLTFGADKQ